MSDNFVSIDNLVSSVLLEIEDEANRRYVLKARQWVLDEWRRVNIHMSDVYLERKVEIDDNHACDIPEEAVKLLTVGIYRNGVFDPFVKLPDMEIMPEDVTDGIYDQTDVSTTINNDSVGGYWTLDKEHGRFFVRNYSTVNGTLTDTTSNISTKIVIRYRTTGLNIGGDMFVPIEAKDYIVAAVYYKFAQKSIPVRLTNGALQSLAIQMDYYKSEYQALIYEPGSFYEVRDAIFGRI